MTIGKIVVKIFLTYLFYYFLSVKFVCCTESSIRKHDRKYNKSENGKEALRGQFIQIFEEAVLTKTYPILTMTQPDSTTFDRLYYDDIPTTPKRILGDYYYEHSKELFIYSPPEYEATTTIPGVARNAYKDKKKKDRKKGAFYDFVVGICEIIIDEFSSLRIPKYFEILSYSLRVQKSAIIFKKTVRGFSKKLEKLSDLHGYRLKQKVQDFLTFLLSDKPKLTEFIMAMNSLYDVYLSIEMDHYLYDLKRYADFKIRHIRKKTARIFKRILSYPKHVKWDSISKDIKLKYQLALIEYLET